MNHNTSQSKPEVPSLYVRVYRIKNHPDRGGNRSLAIREDVSDGSDIYKNAV